MNIRHLAKMLFAALIAFLIYPSQALASTPAYDQCIYALNQTAANALYLNGAMIINAPSCGVVVDSSSATALTFSGSGSFTAKYFDVVGGYSTSGAVSFSPSPSTHSASQADPLTFLTPPTSSACTYTNFKVTSGSSTLNPGTYCNGITISGASVVTFNPGTYILMGGGLNVTGASILRGSGVTFFLTQGLGYSYGPLSVSASVVATLSAPTSGPYYGILFYQDRQIGTGKAANTATGSSASSLSGVLYFPTTALTFSGAQAGGNCLIIVADTITLTGAASLGNACSGGSPVQPPVAVSVTPATATLYGGQTQQFTATVTNTSNTAVTWTISPAGIGTISSAGLYTAPASVTTQQTVTVTATSKASATASASSTVTLLPKTTQTISFTPPASPVTYGVSPITLTATASSGLPVTFSVVSGPGTVSGSTLTITGVGTVVVAANQAGNTYYAAAAQVTQNVVVNRAPQTISFTPPASPVTYGVSPITLSATASSGLPVTFSVVSGPGTVSGNTLTITGVGTVVLAANQAGNTYYAAAAQVTQSVVVNKASQTISFTPPVSPVTYGVSPITLSATASSGLPVTFSVVSGPGTISGNTLTITGGGTVVVAANQAGNTYYAAAAQVTQNVVVNYSTPIANAGPPQTVYVGTTVQLNGTGSSDPAGAPLTYQWSFVSTPAGSAASLSSATSAPTFVADKTGTYKVQLVVNNGHNNSLPSTVVVTSQNLPPVANAGQPQTVYEEATVQLNGTGSYDPAGLPITYQWSFVSVPSGSNATLTGAATPTPTFVADKTGTYTVQLIVNNGVFSSAPSTVPITTLNSPPVANAGPNQSVTLHTVVQLDGSHSTDVDGDPLTYSWSLISVPTGSKAALSSATIVNPTFVVDLKGNYVAQLIVNDGISDSTPSTVTTSTVNSPPVANAGPNETITVTGTVQLDGSGSTDVDGDTLTYSWSFLTMPAGSNAVLSNPNAVKPTFEADLLGTYIVQLIVNDGTVNGTPATVTITSGDVPPVANPGPGQTVHQGLTVNLNGSASTDSDNQPLTYQWSLLSTPPSSAAALSQPTSATPYFTTDFAGNYIVQLIVNDGFLSSTPSTVTISTFNTAPVANAGPNQNVTAGATVQLSGAASSDADGDPLTYKWAILSQPNGGTAALSSPTIVNPTFVANVAGVYVAQLIVNDGFVNSQPATTTITAAAQNQPPVVNAGPNQTITLPVNSVTLNGTATDDGLPNNTLTISWTQISGPAGVTFGTPSQAVTTATFPGAGTYVLQLTADDSQLFSSSTTTVIVNAPLNQPPVVNAGPNQTITLPTNTATLSGTATDDGLPNGTLIISWSELSGPSGVTFSTPSRAVTTATFPGAGAYVLQLAASDSQLSSTSTVTITVKDGSGPNQPPIVNAGPNQTLILPATTITLNGTATDDGLPNNTLIISWSQVSGPGSVVFSNPSWAITQATFNAPGFYDLRLTASDTQLTSTSDVFVYVYTKGVNGQNEPPYVNAGPDQTIVLPALAQLNGVAVDDGLPNGTLIVSWSVVSGPGTVTFSNPSAAVTTASFSVAGDYVLQLAASDSVLASTSNVNVTVGKLDGHMSNKGTDFWLMFPRNWDNDGTAPGFFHFQPQLLITAERDTTGTVTIGGIGFSTSFNVTAGQSTVVMIPPTAGGDPTDAVENKGIHVTSLSEVTIVGLSFYPYSTDGYLALPTPVLGTDYIAPAFPQALVGVQYYGGSEVSVVAAQDGTTVTITPPVSTVGRVATQPYQVILNQGRTYQLIASDGQLDLTGTQVTADKPVAVFGGAACANIPLIYPGGKLIDACNHLIEQIPSTDLWGKNFVVMPFAAQPKGSLIRVLASQDGTTVNVNGSPAASLDRGKFYETITADPLVIDTDKPALVVQYMTSTQYQNSQDSNLGDPSMQLIPPYEQFGGRYVVVTPNIPIVPNPPYPSYLGMPENFLNVVAPTASIGSVQLDNSAIGGAGFVPIGSSSFSGVQVPVVPGVHHLTANSPFGVSLYGMGVTDAYSFQAGVVFDAARQGTSILLTPKAGTQLTGTPLCASASVLGPFGQPAGGIGVGFSVTGANASSTYVDTNSSGIAQYCYVGTNSGTDSIAASVGLASDNGTLTWSSTAPNAAPYVYAGANETVSLPNTANLNGVATDDGLPTGSVLALAWTTVSGPGAVTFSSPTQAITTATFNASGTYVLQLTASDSQLSANSNVTVTVTAAQQNQAPTANAGPNQTITLPTATVTLNGTVSDDGLPASAKLAVQWTEVSGPSGANPVVFSNSTGATTQATLNIPGTYVLQLSTDDSQLSATSTVTITVIAQNQPPSVNPGGPYQITLPTNTLTLNAIVTDDGLPVGSKLTSRWSQVNGPAPVLFGDPTQPITLATFPAAGYYTLSISATDTQLTTSRTVTVTVTPANQPPNVSINPSFQMIALPTNIVTLTGTVTDDGLPIGGSLTQNWALQSGPAAVTFGSPTQAITSVTFTAPGVYYFTLTASDSQLIGSATASVYVTGGSPVTNPNQPPVVYTGGAPTVTPPNNTATLNGVVTDDGLPYGTLSSVWSQVNGPAPVTFATPTQPITQVTFPVAGTYQLRLSATDGQLTTYSEVYVTVNPSSQSPSVSITPPYATVTLPSAVTLTGSATDPNGQALTYQWAESSGTGPVAFSAPNAAVTQVSFEVPGTYYLQLTASNSVLSTITTVNVYVSPAAPGPPQVSIASPEDGQEITKPTTVIGSVSRAMMHNGNGSVIYKLEYSLNTDDGASTQTWTTVNVGDGTLGISAGALGTLDPTMMLNGSYTLRLSATDDYGQTGTTTTSFIVNKNMKVGNFTLSFADMTVPVAGVPMTVTRTYDSRDHAMHDFGTGWSLGIANIRLQKNRILGKNWVETTTFTGQFYNTCLGTGTDVIVTVTFPDGKFYKFQAVSTPQCTVGGAIIAPTVAFTELAGSPGTEGATLVPADGGNALVDGPVPGNVNLIDYSSQTYNPTLFTLTTRDGYVYSIDQHLGLTKLADPSGNTLTINANGIVSSTGKSIGFTRDSKNRITQITDPSGNILKYSYNDYYNGLGALGTFTDAVNNVTNFNYFDSSSELRGIRDPRGLQPITNNFDVYGRLISTTDANGKTITYTNNITGQTESINDRLGNPTVYSYDDDGNILTMTDALGKTTTYTYDSNDNKLTETNALGKTTTYTYDGSSNRLTETDPLGNKTSYTYNQRGQVLTVTDPQQHTTANVYDANGNLTSSTDANGKTTSTVYGASGLPTSVTDAAGNVTQFQYDGSGNLTQQTDALHHVSTYTYDANNNKLTQSVTGTVNGQPQTLTTSYQYDGNNRVTKTTYPDGSTTEVQYNSIGKQSATIDQLNRTTSYAYDADGNLTTTTYPDTTTQSTTYDADAHRLTSTDRAGNTTTYTYDADGRLTKTTYADTTFTQTAYDAAGRVSSTTDANGHPTSYAYDDAGRRTSLTDALTHVTTFTYDAAGNQLSVKDANQNTTQYQYDALNRQVKVTYPDQTFSSTAYDALGRASSNTDQAGKTTGYGYDALGRLTSVTQDVGGMNLVTGYGYDEVGNRISQTDANNHSTTYSYDQNGHRVGRKLPAGQSESYVYDAAGNLKSKTDFNGKSTTYAYDTSNRLLSKTPDASFNAPPVSFTYFPNGLRKTMADPSGSTTFGYGTRNRLTSKQTPFGTLSYTYDSAGDLLTLKSSNTNGISDTYTYDVLNRLSTVTDPAGATTYAYDAVGNLAGYIYPNGVVAAYSYDGLNRLTQMGTAKNAVGISNYAYTLGAAGTRLTVAELSGRNVAYGYDSLYRLTSEAVTSDPNNHNVANGYLYDSVGNRQQWLVNGVTVNAYTYDPDDRLGADTYDANGNTVLSTGISDGYDFENHLVQKGAVTVVYDGDGNRVAETVGGVTTNYLVDTQNPTGYAQVVDELQSGAVIRTYSYGMERISESQTLNSTWTPSFYGYDGHGSVRQLTNSAGAVSDTYDYDTFGNLINQTGSTPNNYLFAAEQYDPALNLYYNRARYLNTATGRFWSMDTDEGDRQSPLSLHKYLYAGANPVNAIDPSGNQASIGEEEVVEAVDLTVEAMPTAAEVGESLEGIARATFADEANEAAAEAAVRMIKATGVAVAVAATLVAVDAIVKQKAEDCHCKSAPLYHYTNFARAEGIAISGFMLTSKSYLPDFPAGAYATDISPSANMTKQQLAAALYFDPGRQARAKNSWFVALCNDDKPGFEPLATPRQWVKRGDYPGLVPVSPIIIGINPMPAK